MTIVQGFGFIVDEGYAEIDFTPTVEVIEPAQPVPELPAECWNGTKPDGARCVAATRSLCGG